MSSHSEAPEISKDPVADSTDVYAFVSPDRPDTVTIIANDIPLQAPNGGSNFFEFGDDVLHRIHVRNQREATGEDRDTGSVVYEFRFRTEVVNPDSFLYNRGDLPTDDVHHDYSTVVEDRRDKVALVGSLQVPSDPP